MLRRLLDPAVLTAALLIAGAAPAQPPGVTLYDRTRYGGERASFDRDVYDLGYTRFGARRASSVTVSRGCRVTLYEYAGYRGRSVELFDDVDDLSDTRLGKNNASSLRIDCRGGGGGGWGGSGGGDRRGVTLFEDADLKGDSMTFDRDVPDLERTRFGSRRASSIEVPSGCMATLFTEPNYRGRSTTFRDSDNRLKNTSVGNDTASSMRVDCGGGYHRPPPDERPPSWNPAPEGVTLYRDSKMRGTSETFNRDVSDLGRTRIGARQASSIAVPSGCRATLFSEPDFRGRSATFTGDDNELKNTAVGNDTAQSIRVECGQRRY